ncbi:unnamed protein product [Haemonchus placei]|uniref:Uncharacterized protein n=1 Tax=Haemonchus placei TaxID=6290 RepID=A0A3P7X721_HAEPC|nr:unnamed protein product [Haemonchus placei]
MIKNVLFPLMCYNDDDEELWNDNVEEFIRFKFGRNSSSALFYYKSECIHREFKCFDATFLPKPYVGSKHHIFEDIHNPVYEAGALLRGLAKRKDIVQPVLAFAINILTRSTSPREVEGALRMIGELESQLTKSKVCQFGIPLFCHTVATFLPRISLGTCEDVGRGRCVVG